MSRTPATRFTLSLTLLAAASLLTACEGTVDPQPGDELSADGAAAIASFLADVDAMTVGLNALAAASGGRTVTWSRNCPAGGSVSVSGGSESTLDEDTRVVSNRWSTTQTHAACAVIHTRGDKSVTAVMDGSVTSSGTSSYQLPEKRGEGRTLLTWDGKRAGATTTTVGDRSNTCVVDVSETYDAATKTFTVTGSVCGRDVSGTRRLGG